MNSLLDTLYKPDVLSCLSDLSNDEVFTPPELANQILDLLPHEIWSDPNIKILDPACKSGVFLREAAKRFIEGEKDIIPDLQQRIDHIMHNQLFGIAITEITSLMARRSLYCSKYPNGPFSVADFDNSEGNIRFKRINHTWYGNKCLYCGASKEQYDRSNDLETHAYEFIHIGNLKELEKMKFDVICGNPPYQLNDGGGGAGKSAAPLYHKFVQQAIRLNPKYLSMIIPSRWFSGGKGLDDFRTQMLSDDRLAHIVDFIDSKDCFPGVDIPGGICYFLWDKNHHGDCIIENISKGASVKTSSVRALNEFSVFIRNNNAVSIVEKVLSKHEKTLSTQVSSRKPFGLESNTQFDADGDVVLRSSNGLGKIRLSRITSGRELLSKWKVIVSKVSFEHAGVPDRDGMMRVLSVTQILEPNSACTESYLVAGAYENKEECMNLVGYLRTKFVRFLITPMLASMNMSKASYSFVPIQDFSKPWTDEELYEKYGLTNEEIAFIDSMIRPMELDGD